MTDTRRATRPVVQRDAEWLGSANAAEIDAARRRGELADLFGATPAIDVQDGVQWVTADLEGASADQIAAALGRGDLSELLAGGDPDEAA
ncbi:hypothetical protein FF36_01886 [Frankia torreyi]|uniref:Uncharacterized protein n=1 Tax=Frankia torreyi TaxID=1856 RepID=A0A0D8BHV0_9ACTN|nr:MULTISPECIES: hypothetical protein [Frankia]KJE23701.1 hypothetical protein FF36_01886 [Frankia torreyi]KQM05687.1 hypothetical protein FF86_1014105 [Frankia sp. CpI1-P]